jgi:hypothetical protein
VKILKILCTMVALIPTAGLFLPESPAFASPLVVEKNLFSTDRKPTPPDSGGSASQSSTPAVPPKALQLDGIMIHGNTKKALIRLKGQMPGKDKGKDNSPFVSVREGEKVSDYVVNKIGMKSVSLEKAGQTFEIYLYSSGKVLPPLAAAPPAHQPNREPSPGEDNAPRLRPQPPRRGEPGDEGMNAGEAMGNVRQPVPPDQDPSPNDEPEAEVSEQEEESDQE